VRFFRRGGQMQTHLSQISSVFRVPKIIKIGLFLTELFKNNRVAVFGPQFSTDITKEEYQGVL